MSPAHLTDQLEEVRQHRIMIYTPGERHAYERGRFYGATAPELREDNTNFIRWFQAGMWNTPTRMQLQFQMGFNERWTS